MYTLKIKQYAVIFFLSIGLVPCATSAQPSATSFDRFVTGDSIAPPLIDTTTAQKKAPNDAIKIVKRTINYQEQITLAVGMLAFIAVILTTTQAWNPN